MNRYSLLFISLVVTLLAACSRSQQPAETFAGVRHAIAAGHYQVASDGLDEVAKVLSDSLASPTSLTELAVLYLVVGDHIVDGDHCIRALEAYRRAMRIAPDSVQAFFATLSPDEAQYKFLLEQLSTQIDKVTHHDSGDIPDFEEPDGDFEQPGSEAAEFDPDAVTAD